MLISLLASCSQQLTMRIEKRAFNARDDPAYFLSYFEGTEAVGVVVEGIYLAAVEGRGKLG